MTAPDEVLNLSAQEATEIRSKALAAKANELPEGYYSSARIIGTFLAITLNLAGGYFGMLAGSAAISIIDADIGPSPNYVLFSTVWTVSQACAILMMGRLTDIFGRRYFVVGTNILGVLGGIIACTAKSMETLIGAQVLLGMSAGQAAGYALLVGEIMSNKHKFIGAIIVAVPNVLTGVAPFLGQRLAIEYNWRWIFYILEMLLVPALVISFIYYRPPSFVQLHGKRSTKREQLKRVDWVGLVMLIGGTVLFLLGISWGGLPGSPWKSGKVLGLIISGAVTLVAFFFYEAFGNVELPIVPMALFKDKRGFAALTLMSGMCGSVSLALFVLYPNQIFRLFTNGSTPWQDVAWMSSVTSFSTWFGIVTFGSVVHIIKHIRLQFIIGAIWMTAFLGAMSTVTNHGKTEAIVFAFLAALPTGFLQDATMLTTQYVTKDEDLGVAFAIVCGGRSVISSIFNAAFIAIYNNKFPVELGKRLGPAVTQAGLPASSVPGLLNGVISGNATAMGSVPGVNDTILAVANQATSDAWAKSYSYVYYFGIALGIVAIACGCYMRDFDQYLTDHVPHQIYTADTTNKDLLDTSSSDTDSATNVKADKEGEK